jgi:hypothetical protein
MTKKILDKRGGGFQCWLILMSQNTYQN